jgi:hypothetical protein
MLMSEVGSARRRQSGTRGPAGRAIVLAVFSSFAVGAASATALAQATPGESCGEKLTNQLRRFNEKCLADLVAYVGGVPKGTARIVNEAEKYWIKLAHTDEGVRAEGVSKAEYPLMKPDTESGLKALGWQPPENEFGSFWRVFGGGDVGNGKAAEELAKALRAYGMAPGEAISITAGPQD